MLNVGVSLMINETAEADYLTGAVLLEAAL